MVASVFRNQVRKAYWGVRMAFVAEADSDRSRRIVEGLKAETALRVRTTADADGKGAALDRATAQGLGKNGDVPVAVILPKGLGATAAAFGQSGGARIPLLAADADPVAARKVARLLPY